MCFWIQQSPYSETEILCRFQDYLLNKECSKATLQKSLTACRSFLKYLSPSSVLSRETLLEYKDHLIRRYSVNSVNTNIAAINQLLYCFSLESWKLKSLKRQRQSFLPEEKNLSRGEYSKLVDAAKRQKKERLRMMLETIAMTGVRVSELSYFTVEQVKTGQVQIHNKGKYRTVLLPHQLKKTLLQFAKEQKITSGLLFRTRTGREVNRSNFWRELKHLAKKAGVSPEKIYPHNFRHLFARTFYQVTKNLVCLADLLGHSNLETTRIYTRDSRKEYQDYLNRTELRFKVCFNYTT